MKKTSLLSFGLALCGIGLFAEEIDGHKVLYYRGGGAYWSGKEWSETSDGAKRYWEKDAIAVINSGNINFPQTNPLDVYGIRWNSGNNFLSAGSGTLRLGAGGILLSKNMNCRNFSGANSLRLMESQTWTNASESVYSINMNAASYRYKSANQFAISAEDGVVLTLAGKMTWNFNVRTLLTNADVRVTAPAKLSVTSYADAPYAEFNARTLTLDGSASTLVSPTGCAAFMAETLTLNNGGSLTVNSGESVGVPLDGVAGRITVEKGDGALSGVVAAASDGMAFPIEVAEESVLILNCTWKGAVRLKLSGAGTVRFMRDVVPSLDTGDFTGTVEIGNATVAVAMPQSYHFARYAVIDGATPTLRYATARPPAAYADGMTLATGVAAPDVTNGWKFVFWDSVADKAYGPQDVVFEVEDSCLKIKPSAPPNRLTVNTEKTWMDWGQKWFVDDSGTSSYWVDGSLVMLANKNTTIYSNVMFGGLRWSAFSMYFNAGGQRLFLGAGGIDFTSSASFRIGAMDEFRLVSSQTWNGAGDGTIYLGDYNSDFITSYPKVFAADENVYLIVSNGVNVALNCPGDFRNADVTLASSKAADATILTIDYSRRGGRDVMLNARTLRLAGNAKVAVQSATSVQDGYAIAKNVVLEPSETASPAIVFAKNHANAYPLVDMERLTTVGTGLAGTLSGIANLPASPVNVHLAEGTALSVASRFENAQERPGAFILTGKGTWLAESSADPYLFTAESIADFEGAVEVKRGAQLAVCGAVDFGGRLVLQDGAIISLKLDRDDRITDWGEVKFPESGTIALRLYRDDGIAAGEKSLDLGMDFSGVSAADIAKIQIQVEDRQSGSPYSVIAEPVVNGSGILCARLASKMSRKNGSFGSMVWIGRDWADAAVPENWVVYPNSTDVDSYNPGNHPSSAEDAVSQMRNNSIYMSSAWRIDLGGREWRSPDGRNNESDGTPLFYGVSNGTWIASQLMLTMGTIEIENGAVFKANGTLRPENHWILGSNSMESEPFVFRVKGGGVADIGSQTRSISAGLYNTDYIVEDGGGLRYYLKPYLMNEKRTRFENRGELVFPYGLSLANTDASTAGALEVNQLAGTLRLAGDFSLTRAEGATSTCSVNLAGGTTVVSNGATFAGWDFSLAEDAKAAIEVPADGDFSAAGFVWGENASLEKIGAGVLRFAVNNPVETANLKLSGGVLLPAGEILAKSLTVEFSGGAIGVEPLVSNENGLLVAGGEISGVCRVRNLRTTSDVLTVPFLTVPAENDPCYTTENVVLERRNGNVSKGRVLREEITVEGATFVRYSAEFHPDAFRIVIR